MFSFLIANFVYSCTCVSLLNRFVSLLFKLLIGRLNIYSFVSFNTEKLNNKNGSCFIIDWVFIILSIFEYI